MLATSEANARRRTVEAVGRQRASALAVDATADSVVGAAIALRSYGRVGVRRMPLYGAAAK
jgi:hypothetical protein